MDFDVYQTETRRTRDDLKGDELRTLAALGIAGEGGEVADLIKKAEYHGHVLKPVEVAKELGDLLWYIATMADGIGWTLSDVARLNVEKLRARYPDGFDQERSQNRDVDEGEIVALRELAAASRAMKDHRVECITEMSKNGFVCECENTELTERVCAALAMLPPPDEGEIVQADFEVSDDG